MRPAHGGEAHLIKQGKVAAQAGKKAEARYFFEAVLEQVPDHPEALLWLAYLAGGGRPSLVYLARLLEVDPANQRARAAIGWARKRAKPEASPVLAPPVPPVRQGRRPRGLVAVLLTVIIGGLATAVLALGLPPAALPQSSLVALRASATLQPSATPSATITPSATATPSPAPTASPSPTPSPLPSPTPTRLPPTPTPTLTATLSITATATPLPTIPVGDSFRWIDVDLTHQRLIAYEGDTPVRTVIVSTGLPNTPTVTGRFKIYVKYTTTTMSGPGYYLPHVPYVMYFYRGYGLHGTYWHNNFGRPMSHGCVNLPTSEAEWLFDWASVGTLVVTHY